MKHEYRAIIFEQNDQQFITSVLPFGVINKLSRVLIYDKDEGGYQRAPEPNHYNKIKHYVLDQDDFLLPTSIILGIDSTIVNKYLNKSNSDPYFLFDNIDGIGEIFRIVDGQHRIMGLREAAKQKRDIYDLLLNVIVIVTKPHKRLIEMNVFNEINSKSKRIKVDLIQLAKYEYRIIEQDIKPEEINDHVSIQVANILNEKESEGVWYNGIKFGIHDEQKIGIIGVNAFRESIKAIVQKYLDEENRHKEISGSALIKYSKQAAHEIEQFVNEAWNKVIFKKWNKCFERKSDLDYDREIKLFYYNDRYYLQKTLGVKSINYLLGSIVNDFGFGDMAMREFEKIISSSKMLSSDWEVGKTFSGYSSESAFNKVSKMIQNKLPIPRE